MPGFFGIIVVVVIGVIAVVILGVWGLPFTLVIALAVAAFLAMARTRGSSAARVESGAGTGRGGAVEPTGMPRHSSDGAETANERVGQG